MFTRSLITQLSDRCGEGMLPTALVDMYRACDSGHRKPDHTTLEATLVKIIDCFESVYIVVDALDECAAKVDFLKWMQSVILSTSGKLHLMVTSRPLMEIERGLMSISGLIKVSMRDENIAGDINAYIDAELTKSDKWDDNDKHMIKNALLPRSGGM